MGLQALQVRQVLQDRRQDLEHQLLQQGRLALLQAGRTHLRCLRLVFRQVQPAHPDLMVQPALQVQQGHPDQPDLPEVMVQQDRQGLQDQQGLQGQQVAQDRKV